MSFADLRSARKVKEDKSFVSSSSKLASTSPQQKDRKDASDAAKASPPEVLEIRVPPELRILRDEYTGRGLYARRGIQPGA